MSCRCLSKRYDEYRKIEAEAIYLTGIENSDYIIYEVDEKTTYDKKSCWLKAGQPGEIKAIIFV